MNVGEIYYGVTWKVQGYDLRPKYHVYIREADWRLDGSTFLFINKSDLSGPGYPVFKRDYGFFELDKSFIGISSVVSYNEEELPQLNLEYKGRLTKDHMIELRTAVAEVGALEGWLEQLVCEALKAAYD